MAMHEKRTQEIGRVVAVFLALGGTTQAEMARATGIAPATVSRRMNGQGQWTADELDAIASFLDVPITTLFLRPEELRVALVGGRTALTDGYTHESLGAQLWVTPPLWDNAPELAMAS